MIGNLEKEKFLNIAVDFFRGITDENLKEVLCNVNYEISFKAEYENNIVGFYFLTDKSDLFEELKREGATPTMDLEKYKDKKGVEGCALGIFPEYRNKGIGFLMIDTSIEYAKNNNIDYIFGQHYKTLNNIEYWKRIRKLIAESDTVYFTIKDLCIQEPE